jgi:hypothetical protein
MEQASKRSSSHEGGLLLDPLHMRARFHSVPRDREDRRRRVSALVDSSISGKKKKKKKKVSTSGFSPSGSTGTGNAYRIFLTGYYF